MAACSSTGACTDAWEFLEWLLDVIGESLTANTGPDAESETEDDFVKHEDPLSRHFKNLIRPVTNESRQCHECDKKRFPIGNGELWSHWPGISMQLPPQRSDDDDNSIAFEQLLANWFKSLGAFNSPCAECYDKKSWAQREAIADIQDPALVWKASVNVPIRLPDQAMACESTPCVIDVSAPQELPTM
jgi:hypothetical protein